MIDSIEISNLRGIESGKLEGLAPLTILTGPNASGKSTVLDALLIGASPTPDEAVGRAVTRHPLNVGGGRWLFGPSGQKARLNLRGDGEEASSFLDWHERCESSLEEQLFARKAQGPYSMVGIRPSAMMDETFRAWTGLSTDNQFAGKASPHPWSGRSRLTVPAVRLIDPGIPIPLHRTYSEVMKSDRRELAKHALQSLIPGFEELLILVDAGDRPVLHVQRSGQAIPVPLAGDGVQAFMQILLETSMVAEGLVLVEEPEVYQHPRAIWQTAEVLLGTMRRGVQVILSTHSLELIDGLLAQTSQDELEKVALFNLKLEAGELTGSRRVGEEITFARHELEKDLR